MPAFFLSDYLPGYNGLVSPGGDNPNVSDVFVKGDNDPVRTLGTMLHELRHVWQHTYHNDWFSGYQSFDKYDSSSKDDYYEQYSEIDATAFQYWALHHLGFNFHLEDLGEKRILVGLSDQSILLYSEAGAPLWKYIGKNSIFSKPFVKEGFAWIDQGNEVIGISLKTGKKERKFSTPGGAGTPFVLNRTLFSASSKRLLYGFSL
jgi:outer membrane protein assembly factor BamB